MRPKTGTGNADFGRLRKTSDVFLRLRTSSGIFGNDRVVFKNPSTPRIKISRLYLRKSWQVYYTRQRSGRHWNMMDFPLYFQSVKMAKTSSRFRISNKASYYGSVALSRKRFSRTNDKISSKILLEIINTHRLSRSARLTTKTFSFPGKKIR